MIRVFLQTRPVKKIVLHIDQTRQLFDGCYVLFIPIAHFLGRQILDKSY